MQSMTVTTKVVSFNHAHGEMYAIQHYVIKFVSELREVGGFVRVLCFPPLIKLVLKVLSLSNYIQKKDNSYTKNRKGG